MNQVKRNLWTVTLADGVSRFGDHFQFLAVTSVTYLITGSALATAAQMVVSGLPAVLWVRWNGRLADRFDPRVVFGVVRVLQALLTLGYLLVSSWTLILALNFVVASAGVFAAPARMALMPRLVGRDRLLKANARQATVRGAAELLGPVLAGWFVAHIGANPAFVFNSLSYLAPAVAMLLVRPVAAEGAGAGEAGGPAGEVTSLTPARSPVWDFLRSRRDLMLLLGAHGAFVLGMWSINALFFPYTKDILGRGTEVMGWAIATYFGADMVAGVIMERWGHRFRNPKVLFAGYALGSVVWMGYTFVRSVPLMLGLSVFDGTVNSTATTLFDTRIQEEAPPGAVGRVAAVVRAIDEACSITGMLLGGWIASVWGVLVGFRFSAGLSVGLLGVVVAVGYATGRVRERQEA